MSTTAEGVFVLASAILVLISALFIPETADLVCLIVLAAIAAANPKVKEE